MDDRQAEFEANFSVLDRYGTIVTEDVFITNPAIGRDEEIKDLILVLLTPEKSAILIGKPGIGKTAIVEGLAYRIQKGDVPDALKGYTIINIKTASLLGTMPSGESKVQKMIDELKTREKVILFIDEIHMLIGSTETSSLDFANIFKEGLGRGSIKVIGATTTEEYERYILRDKAFTRRFQKIEVLEPNREETIKIMMGTLPKFEKQTACTMKYTPFIKERIMGFLVDITSEYKRVYALGSRYPDVCLTLLKQAFSYTVYDGRKYMDILDVRKAIENSKNIYPDVIKKSLPEFDKMFEDLLLEEKGEKEVPEWRREIDVQDVKNKEESNSNQVLDSNLKSVVGNASSTINRDIDFNRETTNSRQMNLSNPDNVKSIIADLGFEKNNRNKKRENDPFKMFEKSPNEIISKKKIRDREPVKSILGNSFKRFSVVGNASSSTGFNDKSAQSKDAEILDNMLLSSDMEVLTNKGKSNTPNINFRVTNELKKGGATRALLDDSINLINERDKVQREYKPLKYKQDGGYNKSLDVRNRTLMYDDRSDNNEFNSSWVQRGSERKATFERNFETRDRKSFIEDNIDNTPRDIRNRQIEENMYNMDSNNYDDFNANQNGKFISFGNKKEDIGENLFGAPMYSNDSSRDNENNSYSNDLRAPLDNSNDVKPLDNFMKPNVDNNESTFGSKKLDFLMGGKNINEVKEKPLDIYGKLIDTDTDMTIRDGKVMDNFSSKYDRYNERFTREEEKINPALSSFNKEKANYDDRPRQNVKPTEFHELKVDKKVIDTDEYVNIDDLNSGNVADTTRYISKVKDEDLNRNKPLVDLNLESSRNTKDNYYDDFYE